MKRRGFLEKTSLAALALSCGDGINTIIGPNDNNQKETLITRLNSEPYATWSPSGDNILFCQNEDIWIMNSDGSQPFELIIFPDKNKSHPNWKKIL